ncbi:alternate-type signal peptide domain-containing protein [Rhodococcus qingshengii]|nr:alternate-type signal peptide domain-containing protein [Rhodococcus qingshengii]AZI63956.1 alternate-type signal peptide domain-containing protein [Rhodococcus sp. NJ-530]QEM30784.1 alternate-type signal peptide domain-containing protein [Rhodococcus qingshengii]THJ73104.1 alternate-type signal peptide domain-containing protein [Rhodococcus qingshengii]
MNIEETEFGNGRVRMNNRIVPASRWNTRRTKMIGTSLVMLGGAAFLTGCADTGSLGSSGGGKPTTTTSVPATTTPVVTTPVESGSLALKTVTAPTWTDQNGPIDLSTMVVVPGDVLTYHASFALEIKGTGMKAKLSTSDLGVSGGAALVAQLKPVTEVKLDGVPVPVGADGTVVSTAKDGKIVDVAIRFTFDKDSATALSMDQSLNLARFDVNLVQIPA